MVTGLFQGLVILLVAQVLRHPPAQPAAPASAPAAGGSQIGKRQFTTPEMLRTPQFYWMYVAFVLMATGGLLVTANAGPIARSWGFSAGALTLAATLSPIANGGSRVFWGWASDRLGRETTMILTFVLQAVCLTSVVTLGQISGAWFAATLVAVYFTWGQIYSIFPSMSGDYFGTQTRHVELWRAVQRQRRGVDHRSVGRRDDFRAVRKLDDGLLWQRGHGADCRRSGRVPAIALAIGSGQGGANSGHRVSWEFEAFADGIDVATCAG